MIPLPPKTWPPVINKPVTGLLFWRDLFCTAAMWGVLAGLCRRSMAHTFFAVHHLVTEGHWHRRDWHAGWAVLRPYLAAAAILGLWILIWGLITLWRRERAIHLPKPEPLHVSEEAERNRCTGDEILEWRRQPICVARFDSAGYPRIGPKPGTAELRSYNIR